MRVLPRRRRSVEERAGTMTLIEHLTELRYRLVVSIYAVAGGGVVGWFLYMPFFRVATHPYCTWVQQQPPERQPPTGCNLVVTTPLDSMLIKLKVVLFIGLAIALPVVLFQLWAFVVPGLTAKEKKYSIPFIGSAVVLFALGVAFAIVTLPKALNFLLGFAGEGVTPLISFSSYFTFVVLVALAFGVSFLFPVILVFLELVGVLSSRKLASARRWSILGISIFCAIITPSSDPYTMLAMTIPMCLFYEAAIIIGRFLKR
jgi:sec-independent protein translocase protein TatC